MKRRELTLRQKKNHQITGFVLFILVNVLILVLFLVLNLLNYLRSLPHSQYEMIYWWFELSPWLVNGGLLLLLFIFRPQMAVGYLLAPFILSILAIGGSVLFIASCLAGMALVFDQGVSPLLGIGVFGALMLTGLYQGGKFLYSRWSNWRNAVTLEEQGQLSVKQQTAADVELLKKLKRDELEIGDDGELHPGKRSRRDQ